MDDEYLIEFVRNYSELYDFNHKKYCDSTHKTKLWIELGKKIQKDPRKCKQRWESLRSQFRKFLRAKETTGQANSRSTWRYEEQLDFLIPHMKDKSRMTSIVRENVQCILSPEEEDAGSILPDDGMLDDPTVSNASLPQWKTPKLTLRKIKLPPTETASSTPMKHLLEEEKTQTERERKEPDEIDLFFDTMKATVKKFSELDRLLVKQRVFQIISEIESNKIKHQCFSHINDPARKEDPYQLSFQAQTFYPTPKTSPAAQFSPLVQSITSAANTSHSPSSASSISTSISSMRLPKITPPYIESSSSGENSLEN